MEKILFDGTVYQSGTKYHGGGEYAIAVLRKLIEYKDQVELTVFFDPARPRANVFFRECKEHGIKLIACDSIDKLYKVATQGKYTKIYSALPEKKYFYGEKFPDVHFVLTIHGLRRIELLNANMNLNYMDEKMPLLKRVQNEASWMLKCKKEYKEEYLYYKWMINAAKKHTIITVSNHSKYSILYHYPEVSQKDICTCYSPAKHVYHEICDEDIEKVLRKYHVKSKCYGLMVSAGRSEKNALRGIKAYDRVFSNVNSSIPKDYKVIVLGVEKKEELLRYIQNKERFVLSKYVEDDVLEVLYKEAHLFLYPTLNEGFGYPPLEAMKYGTLCACSAITSIQEVCGDAVLYYNPICVEEIANRILQSFDSEIAGEKQKVMKLHWQQIHEKQEADLEALVKFLMDSAGI